MKDSPSTTGNNSQNRTLHRGGLVFFVGCMLALLVSAALNVRSSHDWGDDFAQYILQARNITTHQSQFDTGVVQNEWSALLGVPEATPIGWPLLLAPLYWMFGNSIFHFDLLLGFFTFLLGLIALWYYRQFWRWGGAVVLTVFVTLNPWLINFKSSILTDIPFAVFCLASLSLLASTIPQTWKKIVLIGVLTGFAISIRPAGVAIFGAIGVYSLYEIVKRRIRVKTALVHGGMIVIVAFVLSFALNSLIFKTGIGSSYYGFWSNRIFQTQQTTSITAPTATHTSTIARYGSLIVGDVKVLTTIIPKTRFSIINTALGIVFLAAVAIGLLIRIRKPRVIEAFFLVYFLMLVIIQTRPEAGFRYFIPVLPFLFEYAFIGLRWIGGTLDRVFQRNYFKTASMAKNRQIID